MAKIKKDSNEWPLGIEFWAEHYLDKRRPAFRVFRCIGMTSAKDGFMFESLKPPMTIMLKRWVDLGKNDFKPFLIPLQKIRKKYGEEY